MIVKTIDCTEVKIFDTRAEMGKTAGEEIVSAIRQLLTTKDEIQIIFGAAPSQLEVLDYIARADIPFQRINAFQQDEYIGFPVDQSATFSHFLNKHMFLKRNFNNIYYIQGDNPNREEECLRYTKLLHQHKPDISLIGFGENGHIAFNEPHEADFKDSKMVKTITLDEVCRGQQVADGAFAHISDVPTRAITLTIPTLLMAEYVFCTVPTARKVQAVHNCMLKDISEQYPGSIIRRKKGSKLYLDKASGASLLGVHI